MTKYLSDYLEIILFIILNASLVYELNNHHQVAKHLNRKKKHLKKEIMFESLPIYSKVMTVNS